MHDVNKGMECFLGYTGKLDTFSVMEDMESSNEGSLTIVGQWNLILASRF